jgi:hypothetical protein
VVGGTQLLKTIPEVIIVRGTYTYSVDFRNERNGIFARVYSKGGEIFNQNDELIFIDDKNTRRSFRFVEMGEMSTDGGTPAHQNTLALDLASMQWFAENVMTTVFIKNNVKNQMLKFTVNTNRQSEFQSLASCFSQKLNKNLVNDKPLVGNERQVSGNDPISKTNTGGKPFPKRVAVGR